MGAQGIAADAEQRRRLQLVAAAALEGVAHQRIQHPLVKLRAVALQLLLHKAIDGVIAAAVVIRQAMGELQLLRGRSPLLAQQDRIMQRVLQLAHVAGPRVVQQRLLRFRRQPRQWPFQTAGVQRKKCLASTGISSGRWRKGGKATAATFRR